MARKTAGQRKAAPKTELVLIGGVAPKKRKPSPFSWTKGKERVFLETLAETCNVCAAAARAKVSTSRAYYRRRTNAAFRASWADAIGAGYQKLELAMLERALNGTEKIVFRRDGSEERVREYPNQLAMALLKMHRESAIEATSEPNEVDVAEVRERLLNKLKRLKERRQAERS